MKSEYLRQIGVEWDTKDIEDNDPERKKRFETEKENYGIASYDTWNSEISFVEYVYVLFKMYNDLNIVDTHYWHVDIDNTDYDQQDCIDYIISESEKYLIDRKKDFSKNDYLPELYFKILYKILPVMWW